jgi:AcrR family transcriptional regulator
VEDIERTHILEALATIVAERGIGGLTLADALARADVTRRTFYSLFDDLEAALLAAFDVGVLRARERIAPAYDEGLRWRDAIRPALAELLRFLDDEPAFGRLCVVHSLSGGPDLLRRRAEVQAGLWRIVERGRSEGLASRTDPPAVVAEGIVGAVLTVVQTRLLGQDADPPDERPVIELFGSLMSLIALPYLGYGAAQREFGRPAPAPLGAGGAGALEGRHPGEYHGVRLTYRTGRVLSAIAQYPGASNREVAERSGIVDQGQVSKLLARLQNAGVVENLAVTARGAPNSWRLTELGERVERGVALRYGPLAAGADSDPARSGR